MDFQLDSLTTFPAGTTVEAYPVGNWPNGIPNTAAAPVGSASDSDTMTASGLTFDLDEGRYVAYALVGSQHRYVSFKVESPGATATASTSQLDARDWIGFTASTSDKGAQLQDALDAARDEGPGALLLLPPWEIVTAQPIVWDDFVQVQGHGSRISAIKLGDGSDCDVLTTRGFDDLTGETSGVPTLDTMPHSFGLRGLSINGNFLENTSGRGIAIVGYDFALSDVDVYDCAGVGIYTEQRIPWTEDLTVDAESAGPKSYWDRVVAHKCVGGGIYFNGPSDSVWSGVYAYLNGPVDANGEQVTSPASTTAGIKTGPGANGLQADKCHSWGRNQKYAWDISGGTSSVISASQAEGAQTSQVRVMTSDFQWLGGHVYTGEDFRSATGFEVGDGSYYAASVVIESRCTNCEGGAVNERSGDTNRYVVWGYQGAGDIFPSALHTKTVFDASGLLGGRPLGHAEGRQTPTYAGSTPGTTGQVLTRDTTLDAGAKWADVFKATPILFDSFTIPSATAAGQVLTAHVPEIGGVWTNFYQGFQIDTAGRIRATNDTALTYNDVTPPTAQYDVEADFVFLSDIEEEVMITGRMATGADTNYCVFYNSQYNTFGLRKYVAAAATTLQEVSYAWPGDKRALHVKLQIRDAAKKVFVEGVEILSSTDNAITAAGKPGLLRYLSGGASVPSDTTGIHIDNFAVRAA